MAEEKDKDKMDVKSGRKWGFFNYRLTFIKWVSFCSLRSQGPAVWVFFLYWLFIIHLFLLKDMEFCIQRPRSVSVGESGHCMYKSYRHNHYHYHFLISVKTFLTMNLLNFLEMLMQLDCRHILFRRKGEWENKLERWESENKGPLCHWASLSCWSYIKGNFWVKAHTR